MDISILRCPETGSLLRTIAPEELAELNFRITAGDVSHIDGSPAKYLVSEALISHGRDYAYPIIDNIFCFLPHLAISLDGSRFPSSEKVNVAQNLSHFYDEYGWKKSDDEHFQDAAQFEDLRPVSAEYIHRCHMRVNNYIPKAGQYILDVASGGIQFDEYLTYSQNFQFRICVDISIVALREAQKRLGAKGIYVLGDITKLPFAADVIDCVISLHTIYHVDAAKQKQAFDELYRVVKPAGNAVIVYSWGNDSPIINLLHIPAAVTKPIRNLLRSLKTRTKSQVPDLYFRPQNHKWFSQQRWESKPLAFVWRSVSVTFLKTYCHDWLFGRQLLKLIFAIEEKFPLLAGNLGQYPLFIISKEIATKDSSSFSDQREEAVR